MPGLDCPVCNSVLREPPSGAETAHYHCSRCGMFRITRTAEAVVRSALDVTQAGPRQVAAFSHALRRMQYANGRPLVNSDVARRILESATLPTPQEQADNLIHLLGDITSPGESAKITSLETGAIIGTSSAEGWAFIVEGLAHAGVATFGITIPKHGAAEVMLTFAGWARYEELRRGAPSGRKAFLAMQFSDPGLDRIVAEHFRPAVAQTGFDLKRLDDEPMAGLIDARMMLEIKAAWFIIADLTHDNQGAYWEAGYATGLGKPVIYTCERTVFEKRKSHFDTNHHLHIPWDAANMAPALLQLKATIRFTIPEAKQQDDE